MPELAGTDPNGWPVVWLLLYEGIHKSLDIVAVMGWDGGKLATAAMAQGAVELVFTLPWWSTHKRHS